MTRIGIIVGSTRPRRRAGAVAAWVGEAGAGRGDAAFEVVDLASYALPLLDEPLPAAIGDYQHPHTKAWSAKVRSFDGYVFVTPEYNHSVPAALKNAIDFLYAEWHHKAAGLVSYGIDGGVRAAEHLRLILAEVKVADVRSQVALSLGRDFEITDMTQPGVFTPSRHQHDVLIRMLDEVIAWSAALAPLREPAAAASGNAAKASAGRRGARP